MKYFHGQIVTFTLRALYRFGMSFAEVEPAQKKKHLDVMSRHIEFIQECCELLESKDE